MVCKFLLHHPLPGPLQPLLLVQPPNLIVKIKTRNFARKTKRNVTRKMSEINAGKHATNAKIVKTRKNTRNFVKRTRTNVTRKALKRNAKRPAMLAKFDVQNILE